MCNLDVLNSKTLVSLESSTLLLLQAKANDYIVYALVDSGASFNFVSSALPHKLGWKCQDNGKVTVRLADGSTVSNQLSYYGLVAIGPSQHVLPFLVLDLTFDMVLGMPWLKTSNIRVNCMTGAVRMRCNSHWVNLPSRFEGQRQQIDTIVEKPRKFEVVSATKFSRLVELGQKILCCAVMLAE